MYYLFIIETLLFQCFYFVDISALYIQFNNIKFKRVNFIQLNCAQCFKNTLATLCSLLHTLNVRPWKHAHFLAYLL